jgi:hypothetical protein
MAARALLCVALFSSVHAAPIPFSYPAVGCYPNSQGQSPTFAPRLKAGEPAFVCININGKVTSIFNVVVDQYTALTLSGSACAAPRAPQPARAP